ALSQQPERAVTAMETALDYSLRHCRTILAFTEEGDTVRALLERCASSGPLGDYRHRILQHFSDQGGRDAGAQDSGDGGVLSERELAILRLIKLGTTNKVIARQMNISIPTVKWHLQNIYRKLGVRTRTGAVFQAGDSLDAAASDTERETMARPRLRKV